MCYFISVGLPKKAQQKWLDLLPEKMHASPSRYTGLSGKMNDFAVVVIGTGMCSCGLFNRCSNDTLLEADEERLKKYEEKYEKKGWSKSKIARAIQNRGESDLHQNLHPDFRRWLADAVEDAGSAYLFVHWDSDDIDLEQTMLMTVEEFRNQETYVQDEQLIHIKMPGRFCAGFGTLFHQVEDA